MMYFKEKIVPNYVWGLVFAVVLIAIMVFW